MGASGTGVPPFIGGHKFSFVRMGHDVTLAPSPCRRRHTAGFKLPRSIFTSRLLFNPGTFTGPMTQRNLPVVSKWPFFLGDAILLGLAFLIYWQSKLPMGTRDICILTVLVILGAHLSVIPYLMDYKAALRIMEAEGLTNAVLQIQNLEIVGRQISSATANWQAVQDESAKSIQAAREISEGITAEARAFSDFLKKANETEKNHLRLEVEKLRRAEGEWVQILVRMLDHVFALYQAAARSGQENLIGQIGQFQNACRDVARRVGLVPFIGAPGETFDARVHQLTDTRMVPAPDARIFETVASGYSYQGQLIRPALVILAAEPTADPGNAEIAAQPELIDSSAEFQIPVTEVAPDPIQTETNSPNPDDPSLDPGSSEPADTDTRQERFGL
jgi:molecular chaperone GrpE (heat shock protein)